MDEVNYLLTKDLTMQTYMEKGQQLWRKQNLL